MGSKKRLNTTIYGPPWRQCAPLLDKPPLRVYLWTVNLRPPRSAHPARLPNDTNVSFQTHSCHLVSAGRILVDGAELDPTPFAARSFYFPAPSSHTFGVFRAARRFPWAVCSPVSLDTAFSEIAGRRRCGRWDSIGRHEGDAGEV